MHNILFRSQTLLAALFLIAFQATGRGQSFTDINANLDPVFGNVGTAQAAWGDYDGDGDLDLAYTSGAIGGLRLTRLYRNDGSAFTSVNAGLPNVGLGGSAWGDYDNDGDLDLFAMGSPSGSTASTRIYRNNTSTVNNSPATPGSLNSGRTASAMTLVWGQASDPQTLLPAGLTYNLRVGTTPGGA